MRELQAELIESDEALAALEPGWWELLRRAAAATPFQSPAWLIPWWHAFRPGALFTVAIRHGDRLVALAPFYIEGGAYGRRILPVGISVSDYLDVLVDPDWAAPASQALVSEIARHAARWDGWDLEELRPEAAALALPCPPGCTEGDYPQSACPVLRLQGRDGLGGVTAKGMRKLRLARNRAARRNAEIVTAGEEECSGSLAELVRLHGARWASRGEAGVLADETVLAFHNRAAPRLAAAGLLRLHKLKIDGRLAGASYMLRYRDAAYYYLGGFDPDFAFESPGTILVGHAMAETARDGLREFHFLRGQEAYKYEWGAHDRWNRRRSFRRAAAP